MAIDKVFLTGATGFVGGNLLNTLLQSGYKVGCLVRLPGALPRRRMLTEIPGDLLQPDSWVDKLSEYNAVIHLVAIIKEKKSRNITFDRMHVQGTAALIAAVKKAGISRFLHMSALGADVNGVTPYFKTKGIAEQLVKESGLDYTIFRPSFIYGPGDAVYSMLGHVLRFSPLGVMPVFGSGEYQHQPVWVQDVAQVFLQALTMPASIGQVYDVGGPAPLSYNEQLRAIGNAVGVRARLLHIPLGLSRLAIAASGWLPFAPINADQLEMLVHDNICDVSRLDKDLNVVPLPFHEQLDYLNKQ